MTFQLSPTETISNLSTRPSHIRQEQELNLYFNIQSTFMNEKKINNSLVGIKLE